jgi:hypothetical protein
VRSDVTRVAASWVPGAPGGRVERGAGQNAVGQWRGEHRHPLAVTAKAARTELVIAVPRLQRQVAGRAVELRHRVDLSRITSQREAAARLVQAGTLPPTSGKGMPSGRNSAHRHPVPATRSALRKLPVPPKSPQGPAPGFGGASTPYQLAGSEARRARHAGPPAPVAGGSPAWGRRR